MLSTSGRNRGLMNGRGASYAPRVQRSTAQPGRNRAWGAVVRGSAPIGRRSAWAIGSMRHVDDKARRIVYKPLARVLRRERIRLMEVQLSLGAKLADDAVIEIVRLRFVRRADARPSADVVYLVVLGRLVLMHGMPGQGNEAIARQRETGDPPTRAMRSWPVHGDDAVAIVRNKYMQLLCKSIVIVTCRRNAVKQL